MSILIVDDSEVVRTVVRKALNLFGYNDLIEAPDGKAALAEIVKKGSEIELCVFDVNMPKMDGLTLVKEARASGYQAPILMLTTETDKAKMLQAKEYGAAGWVTKPFDSEKFIKVIELLLKKK